MVGKNMGKDKRKNSTLGIVSFVMAIVGTIIPMPIILIFLMGVASVITGLTDLLRNDTSVKHFCSFFGMLIGAGLAIFVALGYFTFV
jgi:membrane associated rhomboid family serine protease